MSQYIHDFNVRKRLFWFQEASRLGVNRACLKLGIYKSHFYYWKKRYVQLGAEGLAPKSRKPRSSPKLSPQSLVDLVLDIREDTQRGADTIALLLFQKHQIKAPRSTINKILKREGKIDDRKK